MIVTNILETIGGTPTLCIPLRGGEVKLYIKLEMFNPTGSMKDRMAVRMVDNLSSHCDEAPTQIVESSSGNTASALAMIAAVRGLEFTALMDTHATTDKICTVSALGGVVRIVGDDHGALATNERDKEAERISKEAGAVWTEQHNNPSNPEGYNALARELLNDIGLNITHFVSAIGTGGSLCGTARMLKKHIPTIEVVGVEPSGSIIFGEPGHAYRQSGTGTPAGANVGLVIDYDVIDQGIKVDDTVAFSVCHYIGRKHGFLIGGSAGGSIFHALCLARNAPTGSRIVTIACDSGTKYLDTIYNPEWLEAHDLHLIEIETAFADVLIEPKIGSPAVSDVSPRWTDLRICVSRDGL